MRTVKKNILTESSATPSQVDELYEHVRSFRRFSKGYRAIHMRFSILDRLHQQPHHRRDIATVFNKLIGTHEGKLFWLSNFDFFFVCKDCPHSKLEQAKFDAIRAVDDSPILKEMIEQSRDDEICDWYDLSVDYAKFAELVENIARSPNKDGNTEELDKTPSLQNLMANLDTGTSKKSDKKTSIDTDKIKDAQEPKQKQSKTIPNYEHVFPKEQTPPMGPTQLDMLERNIMNMDMFALIAEQNICVIMDKLAPQVIYTKKYISLDEVKNTILPGYNISADKWLFQRLTQTFDKKLMQSLTHHGNFPKSVLAINMNVSTIMTKEFDTFIAIQKKKSEHPLILEITLFDIMSDLTEYYRAQKKIKALGCKICICKMDIQSLYILDRELINVDFLKIRWNKNYLKTINPNHRERIIDAVRANGKMRVVISDCDSAKALNFGNDIGIVMYQGFEVDKLQGLR